MACRMTVVGLLVLLQFEIHVEATTIVSNSTLSNQPSPTMQTSATSSMASATSLGTTTSPVATASVSISSNQPSSTVQTSPMASVTSSSPLKTTTPQAQSSSLVPNLSSSSSPPSSLLSTSPSIFAVSSSSTVEPSLTPLMSSSSAASLETTASPFSSPSSSSTSSSSSAPFSSISPSPLSSSLAASSSVVINECLTNPCQNGATCVDGVNRYTCTCVAGYTGTNCETDVNECLSGPCLNEATCTDLVNGYTCTCAAGYNGTNCEIDIDECASGPCLNGATCTNGINKYTCTCAAGYTGTNCQTNIDECASGPCLNGATCIDGINKYTCTCAAGYTGTSCQTNINDCASSPCQNGGTCIDGINRYTCRCKAGFQGINCQININDCEHSPCLNGGRCIDGINQFTCSCTPGFGGRLCQTDIDECASKPCRNGGACFDKVNGYSCACNAGFRGDNCEININDCASSPCENGGTCIDGINRYTCNCVAGFTGKHCKLDINECESGPCQNGGTCNDGINGYTCTCVAGYTGTNCETSMNECASSPCKNGGTCNDGINRYTCTCAAEFTGSNCETIETLVVIGLRILNWNYTDNLKDNSTKEYNDFKKFFTTEIDMIYKDFPGYQEVEILTIEKGSVKVRFRIKIVVPVKDRSQTTRVQINTTQTLIDRGRNGFIGKLQVDAQPEAMEISVPPPPPENVKVLNVGNDAADVTWDQPKNHRYFAINGYFIEYWVFSSKTKKKTDVFKETPVKLSSLQSDTSYVASVTAVNNKGRGLQSETIGIKTKGVFPPWAIGVIVVACILIILIIAIVLFCNLLRKKRKAKERDQRRLTMQKLDKIKESYPGSFVNNAYMTISEKCTIFSKEDLTLEYELGSGEFGVVYKGQLANESTVIECAAKTCKANASDEDVRDLYQELEIMVSIGYHENLVNLIGACEEPDGARDKLYILVEYAKHGSLIDYLKKQRELSTLERNCEFELNYANRLKIALDVAKGMAYLASKRCVHRDLAARNVLLADSYVAKVSDFGLSRDIYETGTYEKKTGGKLPVKWMAIESLEQRKFTIMSDVWSFGVLLWEIETKGLMPHGPLSFHNLVEEQKNGYRLPKPSTTPDKLYRLMGICWSADPKKRPTFPQLCQLLEVLKIEEEKKPLNARLSVLEEGETRF